MENKNAAAGDSEVCPDLLAAPNKREKFPLPEAECSPEIP